MSITNELRLRNVSIDDTKQCDFTFNMPSQTSFGETNQAVGTTSQIVLRFVEREHELALLVRQLVRLL